MRTSRFLLTMLAATACAAPLAGCSSSGSSPPLQEKVLGNYKSDAPGLINSVNFDKDGTHYTMRRAVCVGSENLCIERGTYALSSDYSSVTFNSEKGVANTMPFQATHTEPVSSLSVGHLQELGVSLGGGSGVGLGGSGGGIGVTLSIGSGSGVGLGGDSGAAVCVAGSNTPLTVGINISLVFSFSLGGQSFSGSISLSLGGGMGCPTDGGAGMGEGGMGSGSGGGMDAGGGGMDSGGGGGGMDSGGGGSDSGSGVDADSGRDSGDAGTASPGTLYIPQVVNAGGPVITSPQIVTITYPGDSHRAAYEAFGDAIGGSSYWQAATSQYGVGAGTSGSANHVELTAAAPANMSDTDIQNFVVAQAGSTTSGWPSPSSNVIYEIYIPSSVNLTVSGGPACGSATTGYIGGYHAGAQVNGTNVAYAVVTNCANQQASLDSILQASSHELVEAVTDPQPDASPAYIGFGDAYLAWDIMQSFQDEIGDACEFYPESETTDSLGTNNQFGVQRMWSNQGAQAGSALCVPASSGSNPYYNVNPQNLQMITVGSPAADWNYQTPNTPIQTLGYNIPAGQSATFQVVYFSSGTTGNWQLSGAEGIPEALSGAAPTSGHLNVSIDTMSGNNGTVANVTVQVTSADTPKYELLTLQSTQGSEIHYMPILISNN